MKKTILFFTLLVVVIFSSCDKNEKDFDKKKWDEDYDKKKEACIDLVYPITYSMPDATTITGEKDAIEIAMKDWYIANPNSEEKPMLNYPVDYIVLKTEETYTAENENELIYAKKDCYGKMEIAVCSWEEATEASGSEFEKFIVKELKYDTNCNCIYEGYEKFLENGEIRFLIIYGSKDCVGYGYKVTCENGNCEDGDHKQLFVHVNKMTPIQKR